MSSATAACQLSAYRSARRFSPRPAHSRTSAVSRNNELLVRYTSGGMIFDHHFAPSYCQNPLFGSGSRPVLRPFLGADAGERLDAPFIGGELVRRPRMHDMAVVEYIGVIGDLEAHACILLDKQHRDALVAH